MEFVKANRALYRVLTSQDFIEHVYERRFERKAIDLSISPEWTMHIELGCSEHGPMYFFQDTATILRSHLVEAQKGVFPQLLRWNNLKEQLNIKYINVLIFYFLLQPDETPRVKTVALNAATYYFLLLSLPDAIVNNVYEKNIFSLAMKTIVNNNTSYDANEIIYMKDFYYLIEHNYEVVTFQTDRALKLLSFSTRNESPRTFQQFDCPSDDISHYGFCGLKLFINKMPKNGETIILGMLSNLLHNFICTPESLGYTSEVGVQRLQRNTASFLCTLPYTLHPSLKDVVLDLLFNFTKSLSSLELKADEEIRKEGLQTLVIKMPIECYLNFRVWFLNELETGSLETKSTFIDLISIFFFKNEQNNEEKTIIYNTVLLNILVKFCCESHEPIRNKGFKVFEDMLYMGDSYVSRAVEKYFSSSALNGELMFYAISKLDNNNRRGNARVFKSVVYSLLYILKLNESLFSNKHLHWIHVFCNHVSSNDLRAVIVILKDLAYKYHKNKAVIKLYFNISIPNIVNPAPYSRQISVILSNIIYDTSDAERLSNVVDALISEDYDVVNVFRKLNDFDLIAPNAIRNILDLNLNVPLWKLIAMSIPYTNFSSLLNVPEKLQLVLHEDTEHPHLKLILKTLYKMISKNNDLANRVMHLGLLANMRYLLFNALIENRINYKAIPETVKFLALLNETLDARPIEFNGLFKQKEEHYFRKLIEMISGRIDDSEEYKTMILKDLSCLTEIMAITGNTLRHANFLNAVMFARGVETGNLMTFLGTHVDVWLDMLIFLGRICLQSVHARNRGLEVFNHLLDCPYEPVALLSMEILCDICTQRLHQFDSILPVLFENLLHDSPIRRYKSVKLIEHLVNEDVLKLTDIQYYEFISLLADDHFTVRFEVEYALKNVYVKKYDNFVAGHFVESLIFLNYFEHHPFRKLRQQEMNALRRYNLKNSDRLQVFAYVFSLLSDKMQLNVIEAITDVLILPILECTMPHTSHAFDVLSDGLSVIGCLRWDEPAPKDPEQRKEFYVKFLKSLLSTFSKDCTRVTLTEQRTLQSVKTVTSTLLNLLFKIDSICRTMTEQVFITVVVFTKMFRLEVIHIVKNGDSELGNKYKQMNAMLQENLDVFDFTKVEAEYEFEHTMEVENNRLESHLRSFQRPFSLF